MITSEFTQLHLLVCHQSPLHKNFINLKCSGPKNQALNYVVPNYQIFIRSF